MNTPNKISLVRLCLVPVMMFFYLATFIPCGKFIAAGVFIVGAFTDYLDGHIARKYNLVTDMGKFLDPIADKLLNTTALILLAVDGTIPAPFGAIVLTLFVARDLVVDMLRQIAATKQVVIAADKLGKYKTVFHFVSMPWLMIWANLTMYAGVNATFLAIFMWVGYALLLVATVLAMLSMISYLTKNKAVFSEKR